MSKKSTYRYLNPAYESLRAPFGSKLMAEMGKAQNKAPVKQWIPFIKGLTSKGVKGLEIEDSKVVAWLEGLPENHKLSREDIVEWLRKNTLTVKEVNLSKAVYSAYSQPRNPTDTYRETLYLLNGEKENIDDRLEEIRFELEELDFDIALLAEDPERALRLYEEQKNLTEQSKTVKPLRFGHWSDVKDPQTGQLVANMIGHCRHSLRGNLYFIEEFQSDWAQRGRRVEWSSIPKGPWVTNTEAWAGLLLRRQLQLAASNPAVDTFAWITGSMRNGGQGGSEISMDEFYLKIIPKLADKLLSGTGVKTMMMTLNLGDREVKVPGFTITDKVREKMLQQQPLYSFDFLHDGPKLSPTEVRIGLDTEIKKAREMLGSGVSIRLAAQVIDAATGKEVAGRQIGRIIDVSVKARNPAQALSHEVWHYAHEHLLTMEEQVAVEKAFESGSRLNYRVREALIKDGAAPAAVAQCDDPQEAAAHAFSLWTAGKMSLSLGEEIQKEAQGDDVFDRTIGKLFRKIEKAFISLAEWTARILGDPPALRVNRTAADVFAKLREGHMRELEIAPIEDFLGIEPNDADERERVAPRARQRA